MRPIGSPRALERRRQKAIELLADGWWPVDVAKKLGVDRRSVRRWRARFDADGEEGVLAQPASGRPCKLDDKAKARLQKDLLKGASAFGFGTDLWTCRRVAELIRKRFRVRYHINHVGRLLRGLGWSPQKPQRKAIERDEEAISSWVRTEWPKVKKRPRG